MKKNRYDRILLDIETQRDFLQAGGTCYTKESSKVAKNIYSLFDWARKNDVPVISTVIRVRPGETGPVCDRPHCIEDTEGEQKLARTLLPRRLNLGLRNTTDLPVDLFDHYQQVIFEKRHTDIFAHVRLERLISELPMATFVICGAGITRGIVQAAIGLRSRGFGVIVASDAVVLLNEEFAEMANLRMAAKGVIFAPTSEITAPRPQRPARPFRVASPARKT